jgi:hypothetical protein
MVAIVALGAMTGNQAKAGEFCRQDVTGHMTGCGFNTMSNARRHRRASAATASAIRS